MESYLNNTTNLRPLTLRIMSMLYPQNGDRIVAIDSVTSLHHMYNLFRIFLINGLINLSA